MNKMKMSTLSSQFNLLKCPTKCLANPNSFFIPISSQPKHPAYPTRLSSLPSEATNNVPPTTTTIASSRKCKLDVGNEPLIIQKLSPKFQKSYSSSSRLLVIGAVSVGVVMLLMGMEEQKAMALGPEGPLMEEFWDNVRRYGLYALSVSTGALYAVFLPIYELLKNPISAILVLVILAGAIFIGSQVLSAMVGVSDFNYEYSY